MGEKNIVIPRKDFPYFFSKTLSNLYRSDIFSDVMLASENVQFINAHKIILSLSSSAMNKLILTSRQELFMEESYAEFI